MAARNKYKYTPYDYTLRRREESDNQSNCDALIHKIANFFFKFNDTLSLDDKKQILSMLQEIERANKKMSTHRRIRMYNAIADMKRRY